jgi:general secretion pathway protein D
VPPGTDASKPPAPAAALQGGRGTKPAINGESDPQLTTEEVEIETAPGARGVPAELSFNGPASVRVGEEFEVLLEVTVHEPLRSLPLTIRFDPQVLSFVEARPEELARSSGIERIAPKLDSASGRLDVELQSAAGKPFSGQGRLISLRFAAANARAQTRIALGQINLPASDGLRTIPRPRTLLLRVGR